MSNRDCEFLPVSPICLFVVVVRPLPRVAAVGPVVVVLLAPTWEQSPKPVEEAQEVVGDRVAVEEAEHQLDHPMMGEEDYY